MKIYVAASSIEIDRAERMISRLKAAGHEITEDWTVKIRQVGLANQGLTPELRREAADADFRGVAAADRVVILVPKTPVVTQGAWWEGGVADALDIETIAAGRKEDRDRNIFLSRCIEVDTDDEVFARLAESPSAAEVRALREELHLLKRKQARIEAHIASLLIEMQDGITTAETEELFAQIKGQIAP